MAAAIPASGGAGSHALPRFDEQRVLGVRWLVGAGALSATAHGERCSRELDQRVALERRERAREVHHDLPAVFSVEILAARVFDQRRHVLPRDARDPSPNAHSLINVRTER